MSCRFVSLNAKIIYKKVEYVLQVIEKRRTQRE